MVQRLLGVISVGCDGHRAEAARQTLMGASLLERALVALPEAGCDHRMVSLPAGDDDRTLCRSGHDVHHRPAGRDSLEDALEIALERRPGGFSHVLAVDPLLPLRRPGRLAEAVRLAAREGADCVFSCHRESALLWHRSEMGLVPYFDPARRADLGTVADDLPWLKEDGGFYLLRADTFARHRSRHAGRIAPLETEPREGVSAADPAGLAVCRALLADGARAAAGG